MKDIRVINVSAGYLDKKVLENISFDASFHTLTGIVGVNGSGKTTLLRSIACQLDHGGEIYIEDKKLESLSIKERARCVSYIPQKSGVSISLPVIDVVLMGFNAVLKMFENPSSYHIEKAKDALKEVGMIDYVNHDYMCLSEGQKQLVLLSRLMVEDTKLLLMDEPDSALDFHNRYKMMNRIKNMIKQTDKAGIVTLHDLSLALYFCDQLIFIDEGQCLSVIHPQIDSIEDIKKSLSHLFGDIRLIECYDKSGNRHLCMMWENE